MAVYSGEVAVDAAKILKPDMLISDLVMDKMNGIEAGMSIAKRLPGCHVLLFSGQAVSSVLIDAATTSGSKFEIFPKPIPPTAILDFMKRYAVDAGAEFRYPR